MQSNSIPNFLPSRNAFAFVNSWPNQPDITVNVPGVGTVSIGNAANGLCGGMAFAVSDFYQAHEPPPVEATEPALNTPLYNYIVKRLFDSFNIPGGVIEYFTWMNTPDHDTGIPPFIRRGLAWMTIMNEWPNIKADIDAGKPSPLGLVTIKSINPGDLGHNHQVLAYGYVLDDQQNLTIKVYDPNSGENDNISLSLNISNPTHTTTITTNIGIEPGLSIHGFFRTAYSAATPPVVGQFVTVGQNADGRLEAFLIGADSGVYHNWQTAPNGGWSGWNALGGQGLPITAGKNADGRLELFITGTDGSIYHNWQTAPNSGWSGWNPLGGQGAAPAVGRNADGRLELFVIGGGSAIYHNWQTAPNGGWSGWNSLGGQFEAINVGQNAVGINHDGRLEVFAIGADTAIYHNWQTTPGGGWSGWNSLGGQSRALALGQNSDGRLELFAVGTDQSLNHIWQTVPNGGWSTWNSLGGQGSLMTVGRNSDGRLEAFVVGTDSAIYHNWQTTAGGGWSGWNNLGALASLLTVGTNADGRLEVFIVGTDGSVSHNWQTTVGGGWSGWNLLE